MGRVDDSLIDVRGRQPIPLMTNAGNYRRSAWGKATFMFDNAGEIEPYEFTPGPLNTTKCLLFMNGVPTQMNPMTSYPAIQTQRDEEQHGETMLLNANVENATGLITTTQSELPVGQQAEGHTATAGVPIKGYYALMIIKEHLETKTGPCTAVMSALSQSGIISGPINYAGIIDGGARLVQPILLRQQDYTQAMRDAGDKIIQVQGGVGAVLVDFQIVGLFDENIPV